MKRQFNPLSCGIFVNSQPSRLRVVPILNYEFMMCPMERFSHFNMRDVSLT